MEYAKEKDVTGDVPLYSNHEDDMHCVPANMMAVCDFFFGEKKSFAELDEMMRVVPNKASWPLPALAALSKRGAAIVNIEPFDYERYYNDGYLYLEQMFGKEFADWMEQESNLPNCRTVIPEFLKTVSHVVKVPTVEDIQGLLNDGYLVSVVVDYGRLVEGTEEESFAHMVTITGTDKEGMYLVNDPGLPPQQIKVARERLAFSMGEKGEVIGYRLKGKGEKQ